MSYTTIIKQDGTVTQDTTTSFTDGRIWKLATGESLRISDGRKIFKMGVDGAKLAESIATSNNTTSITIAINRNETKVYIMSYWLNFNTASVKRLDIATMTYETDDVNLGVNTSALRAMIDPTGEKIIWLGDDGKLYKMDLDGWNLESVYLESSQEALKPHTFCMDANYAYLMYQNTSGSFYLGRIDITTMTLEKKSIGSNTQRNTYDSFVLDGNIYMLTQRHLSSPAPTYPDKIYKIPAETWDTTASYTIKDLYTDYGIGLSTTCQFNASGFDNFGTFFGEKDGGTRRWQVNLDTLDCTPARWETYPTKQVFSNDTNLSLVDYSGVNGNNCDTTGLITSLKGCTGSI